MTSDKSLKSILVTGLLVGTLDAIAAILNFVIPTYRNPVRIFQYIASGVFGRDAAFSDSVFMPLAGIIFHYFIAILWTALFYFLYPRWNWLHKYKIVAGLGYGIFIWVVMNRVILPLSQVNLFPFQLRSALIGMGILMIAVGLPVAIRANRYYSKLDS